MTHIRLGIVYFDTKHKTSYAAIRKTSKCLSHQTAPCFSFISSALVQLLSLSYPGSYCVRLVCVMNFSNTVLMISYITISATPWNLPPMIFPLLTTLSYETIHKIRCNTMDHPNARRMLNKIGLLCKPRHPHLHSP